VILDRGALIGHHTAIGASAFVGAGAAVVRDVPDRVQVVGPSARVFRTDVEGR
jgi:serine acetyltransferase